MYDGDPALLMQGGAVLGVVYPRTVFVHRYAAVLVGLPDFSISYSYGQGPSIATVENVRLHAGCPFPFIPPLTLLAWRAIQQPLP